MDPIETSITQIKKSYKDYRTFLNNPTMILVAAGVCIGLATKDTIFDILNNLILPALIAGSQSMFVVQIFHKVVHHSKRYSGLVMFLESFGMFLWYILTWLITILCVYILFRYVINLDFIGPRIDFLNDTNKAIFSS